MEALTSKAFFVGLKLNSLPHDYGELRAILTRLQARRVSKRVWLIAVVNFEGVKPTLVAAVAPGDRLIVEKFPDNWKLRDWLERPEFGGPLPVEMRSRSRSHIGGVVRRHTKNW